MRFFVTGAGGFVGSHVASMLAAAGHQVIAHYRRMPARPDARFETLVHHLSTPDLTVPGRVDLVIHAAAAAAADHEPGGGDPDRYLTDNIIAAKHLLDWASGSDVGGILFLSSLSVYGTISVPVVEPSTVPVQPGLYGASKLFAERLFAIAVAAGGPPVVVARLPGVLGPAAPRNWLTNTLAKLKTGDAVEIFNAEADFNNAVHVADLAAWAVHLANTAWHGFHTLTLAAAAPMAIRQVVMQMHDAVNSTAAVTTVPKVQQAFCVSTAQATSEFNYQPMTMVAMVNRFVSENHGHDWPSEWVK